jgi:hypothetical protein
MSFSRAQQIQASFPDHEPDWEREEDAVLIKLVRDYHMGPDCAASALCELSSRGHPATGDMSVLVLAAADADKWVKLTALTMLPVTHLEQGLDAARSFIDHCDAEMLEKLAEKVNYAFLGEEMPASLFDHEVVCKLQQLMGNWEAIPFAGSLTRDEYIQSEKLASTSVAPFWKILLLLGCGILIASIGLVDSAGYAALDMFMLGAGVTLVVLGRMLKPQGVEWDRNPDHRRHYLGTISENGIDIHEENSWRFSAWSEMTGWKASNEVLVVLSPTGAHVFPVSYFSSREAWERACALCAAKLPQATAGK